MRERIYKNKNPKDDLFDLKQSYGGLVDIEFLTQFNILAYSHKYKDLADNVGNITLLTKIASMGLMDKNEANELIDAYRTYREKQHQQGLNPKNLDKVDKKFVEEHFKNVQKIWNKFSNRVRN
jgi:glutamate-ammonia-ligase adenylyltransferase